MEWLVQTNVKGTFVNLLSYLDNNDYDAKTFDYRYRDIPKPLHEVFPMWEALSGPFMVLGSVQALDKLAGTRYEPWTYG